MSHRPKVTGPGNPLPGPLNLDAITPAPLHPEQADPAQIVAYCDGGAGLLKAVLHEVGARIHHGQVRLTEKHWTVARLCAERIAEACNRAGKIATGRIVAVGAASAVSADQVVYAPPGVDQVRPMLEALDVTLQAARRQHDGRAVALVYESLSRLLLTFLEAFECAERYAGGSDATPPVALSRELFEACGALAELSLSAIKAATLTERAAGDKHFADAEAEWTKPKS